MQATIDPAPAIAEAPATPSSVNPKTAEEWRPFIGFSVMKRSRGKHDGYIKGCRLLDVRRDGACIQLPNHRHPEWVPIGEIRPWLKGESQRMRKSDVPLKPVTAASVVVWNQDHQKFLIGRGGYRWTKEFEEASVYTNIDTAYTAIWAARRKHPDWKRLGLRVVPHADGKAHAMNERAKADAVEADAAALARSIIEKALPAAALAPVEPVAEAPPQLPAVVPPPEPRQATIAEFEPLRPACAECFGKWADQRRNVASAQAMLLNEQAKLAEIEALLEIDQRRRVLGIA